MNLFHRFAVILLIFMFILSIAPPAADAQDLVDDDCAILVLEALAQAEDVCNDLIAGEACFANGGVEIQTVPTLVAIEFEEPGDTVPIDILTSIQTAPVDVETGEWGIVVLAVPSKDQDADEDDFARLIMVGDVALSDADLGDQLAMIDDFTVATGESSEDCLGAPSSLIVQSPEATSTDLRINGADLSLGSTIVINVVEGDIMTIMVVEGNVTISAEDGVVVVMAGQMTTISLGGDSGLIVISVPTDPIDFDTSIIQFIPFQLVLEVVEIPSLDRWTATGVMLEAGQAFIIMSGELVKTIDYMPWSTPVGHSSADCAAAGRTDWDCRCRSSAEWGQCTIDETESMVMVGRVGEDAAFIVGSGGFFTARSDGELFLGPNDNTFEDNVGSYFAIVTAVELDTTE
jgi:hypothetical protein